MFSHRLSFPSSFTLQRNSRVTKDKVKYQVKNCNSNHYNDKIRGKRKSCLSRNQSLLLSYLKKQNDGSHSAWIFTAATRAFWYWARDAPVKRLVEIWQQKAKKEITPLLPPANCSKTFNLKKKKTQKSKT